MNNFIGRYIQHIFGRQSYEIRLANTKNVQILKLLKFNDTVRFFVFPISFVLWTIGFTIEITATILDFINSKVHWIFEMVNDSLWIPVSWFGLSKEILRKEINILEGNIEKP